MIRYNEHGAPMHTATFLYLDFFCVFCKLRLASGVMVLVCALRARIPRILSIRWT